MLVWFEDWCTLKRDRENGAISVKWIHLSDRQLLNHHSCIIMKCAIVWHKIMSQFQWIMIYRFINSYFSDKGPANGFLSMRDPQQTNAFIYVSPQVIHSPCQTQNQMGQQKWIVAVKYTQLKFSNLRQIILKKWSKLLRLISDYIAIL